ncbi:hypothetical protein QFC20_007175 [Naganishia adeliensis]|uniref:Uncharacterized protein n=1 Tax=Naganishia adeliensis TaxID=92952 RepID=A0ACC2V3V3_9TREE|nr:hypothetical protein QFC20_007175 [Naganishia adeliensis]
MLTKLLWTTCLALNILDTLKALKRPTARLKRKSSQHQQPTTRPRVRFEDDQQGPGEVEGWTPVKRLSPVKREYWRSLLQNWIAWGGAVIYQSLILPRLAKHARTIDLSASFVLLLGECVVQLGLMMAVLPFVGVWEGLRRLWRGLRAFSLRGLLTRWRRKVEEKKRGEEVEDVVENLVVETDDAVGIRVTISSPSIRMTFDNQQASSTPNEPSTPTPKTTISRRTSLLPTSQGITAYTLSSPQTLRRAMHQAREIFSDSQRRDAGKKRGEGELVRGMMRKRVGDLEEKRGKAAVGTGKKAGKTVAPVTSVPVQGASSAAEGSTAPKPRTIKPAKTTAEKRPAAAVPPAARATAARGRTRLIGRPTQSTANSAVLQTANAAAQSSSSQPATASEQSGTTTVPVAKAKPRSGTRALSARDSLLTRNSSFAMRGQVPARVVPAAVGSTSTIREVPAIAGSTSAARDVLATAGSTSTAQVAREVPATAGSTSIVREVPAAVESSSTARDMPATVSSSSMARDVSSNVASSSTAQGASRNGSNVRVSGLGTQVPAVPYGYVPWPGQPGQYPVQGVHGSMGYGYPTGMRYVARDGPAPYPYPVQLAQSAVPAGVRPNGSLQGASTMPSRPPARENIVTNASSTTRSKPPARLDLVAERPQSLEVAQPVRPAQPAVRNTRGTIATPAVQKPPSAPDGIVANGSSPSTQATTSTTAIEQTLSSSATAPTPADSVLNTSRMSPVIAELEPPPSSGSGFGLGFGDVAGRRSTSVTKSDDARTRRANVLPGGYPSIASASPIVAPNSPERTSDTAPIHKLTGYTRPSSASADRESSLKSAETPTAPPAIHATPVAPGRPSLRKNNSLGLVTTLESMRSPSMEPTSTFTQVGSFESKHSPFFGQQAAFPSRLRAQAAAEPVVTTTVRTSRQGPLAIQVPADMDHASSKGVFIPVMPLPDITPATSPVAQRHVSFVTARTETENPTPVLDTVKTTAATVYKDDAATAKKQDEPMSPPKSPVAEAQEAVPSPKRRMPSDAQDASPLTSIASLDDDDDDLPGPSSRPTQRTKRPEVQRRATRAMRPVIAKPLGKERIVRKATRASGESSVGNATSSAMQLTRRELLTRSTVRGMPNGARPVLTSEPLSTASTPTLEERTLEKGTNDRKRKEPPQSSAPTQARVIPARTSGLEVRAQRAVRPVLPATVHTRSEFALPDNIIADVTPVRRTRASAGLDHGTTLPRGSPTKKRRISERALAFQSSVEPGTNGNDPLVRRRSRRMQPRENA